MWGFSIRRTIGSLTKKAATLKQKSTRGKTKWHSDWHDDLVPCRSLPWGKIPGHNLFSTLDPWTLQDFFSFHKSCYRDWLAVDYSVYLSRFFECLLDLWPYLWIIYAGAVLDSKRAPVKERKKTTLCSRRQTFLQKTPKNKTKKN